MRTNEIPYLECHGDRHDWDEVSVIPTTSYGAAQDHRCTVCHGIRRVITSRQSGQVLSRYYIMPKDYRNPGMTKADYRKALIEKKIKKYRKLKSVS